VAAESSTGTWTTVWTDLLTDLDYYKGRAYAIEDVPGDDTCFYAFVAYPSTCSKRLGGKCDDSLVGNVFGFKPCAPCAWKISASDAYVMTATARPRAFRSSATC